MFSCPQTQPIPIPLAPLSTLVPPLRCSVEGLNQELEGMFICQPPHPQHRVTITDPSVGVRACENVQSVLHFTRKKRQRSFSQSYIPAIWCASCGVDMSAKLFIQILVLIYLFEFSAFFYILVRPLYFWYLRNCSLSWSVDPLENCVVWLYRLSLINSLSSGQLLEVPDGHRAPIPPQSCSSGSQSDPATTPQSTTSSPSPPLTYICSLSPNSEGVHPDMHQG